MPWINKELCTGCNICVDECCVGAISMEEDGAVIDEVNCIRCAVCHDICPTDAVRHDHERFDGQVQAMINWAEGLLKHEFFADDEEKRRGLLERLKRHLAREKRVYDKTLEYLNEHWG